MSAGALLLGLLRMAAIALPTAFAARRLCRAFVCHGGVVELLATVAIGVSILLVGTELLGLVGLVAAPEMIVTSIVIGAGAFALRRTTQRTAAAAAERQAGTLESYAVGVALVLVAAEWLLQTANALGAGMTAFDTLWYHMPFAAHVAQTGSVTGVQFTQADPFTAYYPENSELLHAIGIIALGSDLLSPLLNLLWLAVALVAGWCIGRPWGVQRLTLVAVCVLAATPVMSVTQPGQAFNDIAGLAALLAAVALTINLPPSTATTGAVGLALGLALGAKPTFIVPVLALTLGVIAIAPRGKRAGVAAPLLVGVALTSGWWYLRNVLATGNPLGLKLHLGLLTLPGPDSALADAAKQTVFSQLRHVHLIGSRIIPGLDRGLGPGWPAILLLFAAATVAAAARAPSRIVRLVGLTALISAITYLFAPTGATQLATTSALFALNLRYAMPSLALGLVLLPILIRSRLSLLAPLLAAIVALTQLQRSLWPTQTARHLVFAVGLTVAAALGAVAWRLRARPQRVLAPLTAGLVLLAGAALFAVQRHYFNQRYRVGFKSDPGLGAIYRAFQGIAQARVALYGTVEQYPLYGEFITNRITYLGSRTSDGGYVPIGSCRDWRATITRGHYDYLVLTPAPTRALPLAWTTGDQALTLVLHPTPADYVFRVTRAVAQPC